MFNIQFCAVPFVSVYDIAAYLESIGLAITITGDYVQANAAGDYFTGYASGFTRFISGSGFWLASGQASDLSLYFNDAFTGYASGFLNYFSLSGGTSHSNYVTSGNFSIGLLNNTNYFQFDTLSGYATGTGYQYGFMNLSNTIVGYGFIQNAKTGMVSSQDVYSYNTILQLASGTGYQRNAISGGIFKSGYNLLTPTRTGNLLSPDDFNFTAFSQYPAGAATGAIVTGINVKSGYYNFTLNNAGVTNAYSSFIMNSGNQTGYFLTTNAANISNSAPFAGAGHSYLYDELSYLVFPFFSGMTGITDFTCEMWINRALPIINTPHFMCSNSDAGTSGFRFATYTGQLSAWVEGSNPILGGISNFGRLWVPYNQWVHLAVARQNTTHGIGNSGFYFYTGGGISGWYDSFFSPYQITGALTSQSPMYLGKLPGVDTAPYSGYISQFRFWNYARSQAQIQANYQTVLDSGTPGLLLNLNF